MKEYHRIVNEVLKNGETKTNRTGIDTITDVGLMFKHDMSDGFPLLTTKRMSIKNIAIELEGFINGITDKKWFQDKGCHIWDEWCSPIIVAYGNDNKTKEMMMAENILGPIYGFQWRHFGADYDYKTLGNKTPGVDQLKNLVNTLKTNPNDRRMIVSAWNPMDLGQMALPPCHYGFQITVINGRLNLLWNQRSVDVGLGLPYNIASYAILLLLLALESGFKPGKLIGFLGDTHIYKNHIQQLSFQVNRECYKLPELKIKNFKSIFEWQHQDLELHNYKFHPSIKLKIAV